VLEAEAGGLGHRREVAEHAMGLRLEPVVELHRLRVEADLTRQINHIAHANRLRVGSDCRGCILRLNYALHVRPKVRIVPVESAQNMVAEMSAEQIRNLEKLLDTPRDGALLRYALGTAYLKAGQTEPALAQLREALARDPRYSAAWKALGNALSEAGRDAEALETWRRGIAAAREKGDRQAEKEMTVFARRLEKKLGGAG